MATRLGDASIRIELDPGTAQAKLEALAQDLKRVDDARKETKAKADRDESDEQKKKEKRKEERRKSIVDQFKDPLDIAATLLEQSSLLGTSISESTKGTMFESIGTIIEGRLNDLSAKVIELRSQVDAFRDTAQQTVEYNMAALQLGGEFPQNQTELIKQIHEISAAQKGLTRTLDVAMRREFIRLIFGGVKRALSGNQ